MQEFWLLAGLIWLIVLPIAFLVWQNQKKALGKIKCSRCGHVGAAKGKFVPFKGVLPVCSECGSENWTKVTDKKNN